MLVIESKWRMLREVWVAIGASRVCRRGGSRQLTLRQGDPHSRATFLIHQERGQIDVGPLQKLVTCGCITI